MSGEQRATPLTAYVAQRVRVLRKAQQVSGQKLSEKVNAAAGGQLEWDRFNVSSLESGRRRYISVDEVYALAKALDVSPSRLLPPAEPPTLGLGEVLGDTIAVLEALREGLTE